MQIIDVIEVQISKKVIECTKQCFDRVLGLVFVCPHHQRDTLFSVGVRQRDEIRIQSAVARELGVGPIGNEAAKIRVYETVIFD